jgi:type IV pilus assembly protein PilY1
MNIRVHLLLTIVCIALAGLISRSGEVRADILDFGEICKDEYSLTPPFLTGSAPPLVMLVMGKNHKLFYEAYNDASDIDGDGELDVGYDPSIDYYGYFNSQACYEYQSGRFEPTSSTGDKTCNGTNEWSGDYLNYLTMSRIDTIRKVLYGGKRSTDSETETVLERAYIPQDAHSWGKSYNPSDDDYSIADYTPFDNPSTGNNILFACTTDSVGGEPLLKVVEDTAYNIWQWVSKERPVANDDVMLEGGGETSLTIDHEYVVRVQCCDPGHLDKSCKLYKGDQQDSDADDVFKPIGILQRYGEDDRIYFGLISGSYEKNMSGGVLRKNVSSISDEVNNATGQFKSGVQGIIHSIDAFNIYGFNYNSNGGDSYDGGWVTSRTMNEKEFPDWGNPIAEMMYEGLRYFSGAVNPTSDFDVDSGIDIDNYHLPSAFWDDPYGLDNHPWCAKPIMLVISDIYPNYDTDQLPGSAFSGQPSESLGNGTLNVSNLADIISANEDLNGTHFIGENNSVADSSCSPKASSDFGEIRGLCPEEPTKEGGYYSGSVAYYGKKTDIHDTAENIQSVDTYSVALSSPLPEINVEIEGHTVTIVPFGKTVSTDKNNVLTGYQPTNTIVDYYVESVNSTYGKFRINFEDVEQGADHDMDTIVIYEYQVNSNGTLSITLEEIYAAAGYVQHIGYFISGTTADGTYLEVTNSYNNVHNSGEKDVDYELDTPPGQYHPDPINWNDNVNLPEKTTRTFVPSGDAAASLLKNPLWYAAKWGGFNDSNNDFIPQKNEWDQDNDGVPDTYFFVNNPNELEEKLNKAFASILERLSAGSAASVVSGARSGEGALYQAVVWPSKFDTSSSSNEVTWTGDVHALLVNSEGNLYADTNQSGTLDGADQRAIIYFDEGEERSVACIGGKVVNGTCNSTTTDLDDVDYLWSAADWLRQTSLDPTLNRSYLISEQDRRLLFTWFDEDHDGVVDYGGTKTIGNGEVLNFLESDLGSVNATAICKGTVINWIRGQDQTGMRSRLYQDGGDTIWRLGDVIHSTPVAVGRPSENYDLLWGDESYTDFYRKYRHRRNVIYFGGNDGMLHAVNGGFYSSSDKGFFKEYDSTDGYSNPTTGQPELGAELWGYIPYNLLPHLKCLTAPDYEHKYYVDLHPRVFDVRIWEDEWNDPTGTHPNGWGTILVCGMRFGGMHVDVGGRDFSSSYFIFDITDPEQDPVLMGEVTYDYEDATKVKLGYSISVPTVVPVTVEGETQKWYLLLGSGPDAINVNPDQAISTQNAKLAVIPLNELAKGSMSLKISDQDPDKTTAGVHDITDANNTSYVGSDLVAVDHDFDFLTDIVYGGLVSGSAMNWGGGVFRVKVHDSNATEVNPADWQVHELINTETPVTGAPNVGMNDDQIWVYFGTGRFLTAEDSNDNSTEYFFGIKEPQASDGSYTFDSVNKPDTDSPDFSKWIKSSDILVQDTDEDLLVCADGGSSCVPSEVSNFNDLEVHCVTNATYGWFRELNATERVVGQPTLLGGLINYTAYTPDNDPCTSEGSSFLQSVYYLTGTSWTENVYGESNPEDTIEFTKDLGRGLSITPTMHLGSKKGGKLVIQTSTGEIKEIHQSNLPVKNVHSGKSSWHTHDIE